MSRNELLAQSLEPGSREINDQLFPLVAAGNEAAREKMIRANMGFVATKVQDFLRDKPAWEHLRDDLISQGFVGLIQAVNKMAGVESPDTVPGADQEVANPTGLISIYIFYRLGELIDSESAIRIPGRTFRRHKQNGREPVVPIKEGSLTVEDTLARDGERADPCAMTDLWDELLGSCQTETEKRILVLKSEGRTDQEVADILGLPKTTAYMMRRAVYGRFLERNPEVRGEV